MTPKHRIRTLALQTLFMWDSNGARDDEQARSAIGAEESDPELRDRAVELAAKAWDNRGRSDQWVERLAPQWPVRRQPAVDRNILRLAVWELVGSDTPPKVVLDEAIELAKMFSTENSPAFVNGVLDAVLREKQGLSGNSDSLSTLVSADTEALPGALPRNETGGEGSGNTHG